MAILLFLAVAGPWIEPATACPFCVASPTLCNDIDAAAVAVIAELRQPAGAEPGPEGESDDKAGFAIVRALKGRELLGDSRTLRTQHFGDAEAGVRFLIVGNDPPSIRWVTPIALTPRGWGYLRQQLEFPPDGTERLVFAFGYLDDPEEMLRQDAYDEFARAPFDVVKTLAPKLDPAVLLARIRNPQTSVPLVRLYCTLLSISGGAEHVAAIEELLRAKKPQYFDAMDAMSACYLRLKGPDGLPLISELYLRDVPAEDGRAANGVINALRFHGQEPDIIPRAKVIETMRLLLDRPQLASLVLPDLARWEDWAVIDQVAALFTAPDGDNSIVREAVVGYLRACPLPEAKAQLERLEKIDPVVVRRGPALFARNAASSVHPGSAAKTAATITPATRTSAGDQPSGSPNTGAASDVSADAKVVGFPGLYWLLAGGLGIVVLLVMGIAVVRSRAARRAAAAEGRQAGSIGTAPDRERRPLP